MSKVDCSHLYRFSSSCPAPSLHVCAVSNSDTMPDGPPVPDFTENQKKEWKGRLKQLEDKGGGTFSYEGVGGWKGISPLHLIDKVSICLLVTSDGELHCAEPGCKHTKFGESKYTRGEKQVNRHIASFHPPQKATKGSANGSSGGEQVLRLNSWNGASISYGIRYISNLFCHAFLHSIQSNR